MIAALAKSRAGRLLLVPLVILAGAWSWWSYVDGTQNPQDAGRLRSWWGWLDPRLDAEWARFQGAGSRYHLLKNMGSEWCRTDAQRGYKALSFVLVVSVVLAAVVVGLAAFTLGVVF